MTLGFFLYSFLTSSRIRTLFRFDAFSIPIAVFLQPMGHGGWLMMFLYVHVYHCAWSVFVNIHMLDVPAALVMFSVAAQ